MVLVNIFAWLASRPDQLRRHWLMLGKGSSFSKRCEYDLQAYVLLTLNDAVREVESCALAHFIDMDAFERNADIVLQRASAVVMPWFPHVGNIPAKRSLADFVEKSHALNRLADEGRLFWYDLDSSSERVGSYPVVSATFFSAEAAFSILATAGVRCIRSLGIDGGSAYSREFTDLIPVSRLSNGQGSFDRQFESFARVISRTGVDYAPLDVETPIRVYVASTASEMLAVKVLEYSIRQHASMSVRIEVLCNAGIDIPLPRDPRNHPRTPFSFQRFLIPKLAGFSGRAIYLDSDMQVFKDIRSLWDRPFNGTQALSAYSDTRSGRKPQFSVMLLDCASLDWDINRIVAKLDSGELTYEDLMYKFALARTEARIEPAWNALETFSPEKTALLHYTDMSTQPWVSTENPLGYLWVQTLRSALQDGFITRDFIVSEVEKGHIRPSLVYQMDQGFDDPLLLPASGRELDRDFVAPYRSIGTDAARPWVNRVVWMRALLRAHYQRTMLYRFERRLRRKLAKF